MATVTENIPFETCYCCLYMWCLLIVESPSEVIAEKQDFFRDDVSSGALTDSKINFLGMYSDSQNFWPYPVIRTLHAFRVETEETLRRDHRWGSKHAQKLLNHCTRLAKNGTKRICSGFYCNTLPKKSSVFHVPQAALNSLLYFQCRVCFWDLSMQLSADPDTNER